LDRNIVIAGLLIALGLVAIMEILRFKVPACNDFFCANFKGFYRPEEANKVSGLIGTLGGALLTVLIFDLLLGDAGIIDSPREMVFASFLYLSFGDSAAALVGRSIGKHKLVSGKSIEGSLACLIACFIAGLFLFNWQFALIGALMATILEAFPWKINDNFWMQIINAGLLSLLSLVLAFEKIGNIF